jgi:hypothetical protein
MSHIHSATASVESATSVLTSDTSTELETTATASATSADLSSTIATSTSNEESTTEVATTATAPSAETTSLEVSVTTTTNTETTTSQGAFEPIPTFDVIGKGAQVDGQYLLGFQSPGFFVGWQYPATNYRLTFSIDASTNRVRDVNGNTLCIQYGENGNANLLLTCSNNMLNQPDTSPVICDQTRDRVLQCSAPAKACTYGFESGETTCSTLPGIFDEFYTYSGRNDGIFLAMAGAVSPGANYQAVELGITPNQSK